MTRLELANQLIENQSAFHFAFIPEYVSEPRAVARWIDLSSCRFDPVATARGSDTIGARGEIRTHHEAGLKSAASSNWATRAKRFELVLARGFEPSL